MKSNPVSSGRRPTVIALHGSGGDGSQWSALRTALLPAVDVLTPDLIGHGEQPDWHGFDEHVLAADAARVAHVIGGLAQGAHLVGHAYGGAVALRVALHHAPLVRSVAVYEPLAFRVLLDYGRKAPVTADLLRFIHRLRVRLHAHDGPGAAARLVDYCNGAGTWNALPEHQRVGLVRRMGVVAAHLTALVRGAPHLWNYRSLRTPTLLLLGRDTFAPARAIGTLLQSVLPAASIERIAAMGHMGPVTHPHTVAQRLARFIRDQAIPRQRAVAA